MNARELVAPYVLDQLDPRERSEFERALSGDPELRAEVESMQALTGQLGRLPGDAWPRANPEQASNPERSRPGRNLRPALLAASILAALAIGIGIGAALEDGGGPEGVAPVAVLRPLASGSQARGTVSMPRENEMELTVVGLADPGAGHYYEVWLMSSATRTVPVASFRVSAAGSATVRVPLPAAPQRYRYFDVSLQRTAGGTAHSNDSVLRGATGPS